MKTFLKKIVGFLCFFIATYILVMFAVAASTKYTGEIEKALFVNQQEGGGNYYRIPEAEVWLQKTGDGKNKGILIGSSTVYRNINPFILSQKTGIDFFNFGSSNQSLRASYIILKDILEKNSIEYVFLDVSPMLWNAGIDEAAFDWGVNNRTPLSPIPVQLILRCYNFRVQRLYWYNVCKRMFPGVKDYIQPGRYGAYFGKGWVKANNSIPKEQFEGKSYNSISVPNANALQDIVALTREHAVSLFVYISYPLEAKVDESVVAGLVPSYFTSVSAGLTDSMYYDSHHMYESGTTANSLWIAKYVNSHK